MYVSDLFVSQHLPLTTHQFFEEVNSRVVIGWQEDSYLTGKEVVDLSLAAVLNTELL